MRVFAAVLFFATLAAGSYVWHRAQQEAAARAAWLADPIADDDTAAASLFPSGFLNRDVIVSAYVLGDEARSTEDYWVEEISHGDLAADFYRHGFRRIRTYDKDRISRTITLQPPSVKSDESPAAILDAMLF